MWVLTDPMNMGYAIETGECNPSCNHLDYDFPFLGECHNPNWRTPSFFRGVRVPPTRYRYYIYITYIYITYIYITYIYITYIYIYYIYIYITYIYYIYIYITYEYILHICIYDIYIWYIYMIYIYIYIWHIYMIYIYDIYIYIYKWDNPRIADLRSPVPFIYVGSWTIQLRTWNCTGLEITHGLEGLLVFLHWLVVWNIFIFHIIYGIILPIDVHIFQRDWNHQPVQYVMGLWNLCWKSLLSIVGEKRIYRGIISPSMPGHAYY